MEDRPRPPSSRRGGRTGSGASEAGGGVIRRGAPVILACFLAIFIAYTSAFILGPMLDAMGREMGLSITAMGQLTAITFIPWGLTAPLLGPLSDRWGRKPVVLVGLLGISLSNAALSFADGYAAAAVCRFATGLGGALVPPTAVAAIGDNFSGRHRGLALGLATSGVAVGLLVGLPGVAFLTDWLGWRGALRIAGALGLLVCLCAGRALPARRRGEPPVSWLASFGWTRRRVAWLLMSGNVIERVMTAVFLTYVSVFLLRRFGLSLSSVGSLITAMSVGALIGGLLGGALAGLKARFLVITALTAAQGALLTAHFSWAPLLAAAVAAGFLFSLLSQLSRAAVMDRLISLAPQSRGAVIGAYAASNQVGLFLGAALGGFAIRWGGFEALGWLALAAAAAGGAFYGSGAWLIRREG